MTVRRTTKVSESSAEAVYICVTFEELLLKLGFCDLDLNSLVNLLLVPTFVIRIIFDSGREESIDECGLP